MDTALKEPLVSKLTKGMLWQERYGSLSKPFPAPNTKGAFANLKWFSFLPFYYKYVGLGPPLSCAPLDHTPFSLPLLPIFNYMMIHLVFLITSLYHHTEHLVH